MGGSIVTERLRRHGTTCTKYFRGYVDRQAVPDGQVVVYSCAAS